MKQRHCPTCMHAHNVDADGNLSCGEVVGLCFCDISDRCPCDDCVKILVEAVHEAMQKAPIDHKPFRQARAAVRTIRGLKC